jgi:hypothetical protein
MLLTTECVIVDKPQAGNNDAHAHGGGGGMGGMM